MLEKDVPRTALKPFGEKKSLPKTPLVLDCFGHMVNFKLWHDLRFLRFLDHQRNSNMTLVKLHVSMRARPWSGILWSSSALMLPESLRRCVHCLIQSLRDPCGQDIDGLQPAIRPPTKSWPSWPWYSQPMILAPLPAQKGNSACTARPPNQTSRGLSICSEHYTSSSTWLEQHTHPLSLPHVWMYVWITRVVYKEQTITENVVLPLRVTS